MKQKRGFNIWLKILLYAGIFIIFILIGNVVAKSVIEKKIRVATNQFAPYIKTSFKTIHINLLTASMNFDSILIQYQPNQAIQPKHEIYFSNAVISGINFFKLIGSKNFTASSFKMNNGKINLNKYLLNSRDSLPASVLLSVKIPFKNFSFGLIEINNIDVFESDSLHQIKLMNANISLNDVAFKNIDSSFSKTNIAFSNVSCGLNNISYNLPGYHALHIKSISLISKDSSLKIDSIKIIPQLGKIELGQKLGHQADYINAEISSVTAEHLDVRNFMNKKFYAGNLTINQSKIYFFRDRRLPREMKQQPMPLDYLKKIPAEVYIDHFNLKNTSVSSEEFPKDGLQIGYIKIDNVVISAAPFFNHPQQNNASVISHVKGSIMDAGTLEASINLSLITGNQNIHGSINNLQLPAMNPSAENLGKFKVESGVLNSLDFNFIATNKKATGKIVGVYHDLVIDKLRLDKNGNLKTAKLPSFALHHIIIPKNKDASLDIKHRTGTINYDRDPTRMVTFYLLKSLLNGIRDSFALGFVLPQ